MRLSLAIAIASMLLTTCATVPAGPAMRPGLWAVYPWECPKGVTCTGLPPEAFICVSPADTSPPSTSGTGFRGAEVTHCPPLKAAYDARAKRWRYSGECTIGGASQRLDLVAYGDYQKQYRVHGVLAAPDIDGPPIEFDVSAGFVWQSPSCPNETY